MGKLYLHFTTCKKYHQTIPAHNHQNRIQTPQHNSIIHQANHRPEHPTSQQSGSLPVNLQILQPLICMSKQPSLKNRFQEHIGYIKSNYPQSAYAQHILRNQHEYGTLNELMTTQAPQTLEHVNPLRAILHQYLHQAG